MLLALRTSTRTGVSLCRRNAPSDTSCSWLVHTIGLWPSNFADVSRLSESATHPKQSSGCEPDARVTTLHVPATFNRYGSFQRILQNLPQAKMSNYGSVSVSRYHQSGPVLEVEPQDGGVLSAVPPAEEDLMFGLSAAYNNDPHPRKVNLGVGTYRDEQAKPWVLPAVAKVSLWIDAVTPYAYPTPGQGNSARRHRSEP